MLSMHAEHTAGGVLREIINGTPWTGKIKVVLMKPNHKQIRVHAPKEAKNREDLTALHNRARCVNSVLLGQLRRPLMQLAMKAPMVFLDCVWGSRIGHHGK